MSVAPSKSNPVAAHDEPCYTPTAPAVPAARSLRECGGPKCIQHIREKADGTTVHSILEVFSGDWPQGGRPYLRSTQPSSGRELSMVRLPGRLREALRRFRKAAGLPAHPLPDAR